MRKASKPKACHVAHCKEPASHQFLARTGAVTERVCAGDGTTRIRTCRRHFMMTVSQIQNAFRMLPDGGPARLVAVPLLGQT